MKKVEYARNYRLIHHEKPALTLGSVFYAREERKDIVNRIYHVGCFIMRVFHFASQENIRDWRLWLYGYSDLAPFVSAKNGNTFIWKREEPNLYNKFVRYSAYMHKLYLKPELEIEVRNK